MIKKKEMELKNKEKEEIYIKRLMDHEEYEKKFIKKKEDEYQEKKKIAQERNKTIKKKQEDLQIKIQRSLDDLREKIEFKEKTSQNFLSKLSEKKICIIHLIKNFINV